MRGNRHSFYVRQNLQTNQSSVGPNVIDNFIQHVFIMLVEIWRVVGIGGVNEYMLICFVNIHYQYHLSKWHTSFLDSTKIIIKRVSHTCKNTKKAIKNSNKKNLAHLFYKRTHSKTAFLVKISSHLNKLLILKLFLTSLLCRTELLSIIYHFTY